MSIGMASKIVNYLKGSDNENGQYLYIFLMKYLFSFCSNQLESLIQLIYADDDYHYYYCYYYY